MLLAIWSSTNLTLLERKISLERTFGGSSVFREASVRRELNHPTLGFGGSALENCFVLQKQIKTLRKEAQYFIFSHYVCF